MTELNSPINFKWIEIGGNTWHWFLFSSNRLASWRQNSKFGGLEFTVHHFRYFRICKFTSGFCSEVERDENKNNWSAVGARHVRTGRRRRLDWTVAAGWQMRRWRRWRRHRRAGAVLIMQKTPRSTMTAAILLSTPINCYFEWINLKSITWME